MTVTLMRGSDLIGRTVVDASTGNDLAEIKDVVFAASRGSITGFTLRRRGFFGRPLKTVLPINAVLSVGTDAVLVATAEAISDQSDTPPDMASNEANDVLDDKVFTVSGRSLGTVTDVVILGGSAPRVVGFEIGGGVVGNGLIPLGAQAALSGRALVVRDEPFVVAHLAVALVAGILYWILAGLNLTVLVLPTMTSLANGSPSKGHAHRSRASGVRSRCQWTESPRSSMTSAFRARSTLPSRTSGSYPVGS